MSDPVNTRMRSLPTTVVSTTLEQFLDWPNATVVSGSAVDVVARLREESEVPLRSHGSLSMNRALMAAGLVDYVQATLFPVITGQTGVEPIFKGAADFALELVEHRTLDRHIQELIYRPPSLTCQPRGADPRGRGSAGRCARRLLGWVPCDSPMGWGAHLCVELPQDLIEVGLAFEPDAGAVVKLDTAVLDEGVVGEATGGLELARV